MFGRKKVFSRVQTTVKVAGESHDLVCAQPHQLLALLLPPLANQLVIAALINDQ